MIKIECLVKETLEEAIGLADSVFLEQGTETANLVFSASLDTEKNKNLLLKLKIPELSYWVAISFGRVVGTIGLYCYEEDKDEASWMGWFCVHPDARNRGIGVHLLQFAIKEAKRQNKKFLRLYTTTNPNELNAHRLYEKYGFVRLPKEEMWVNTGFKKLYYELNLGED